MQRSGLLTAIGHIALYTTLCSTQGGCSVYDAELIGSAPQSVGTMPSSGSGSAGRHGSAGSNAQDAGGEDEDEGENDAGTRIPTTSVPIDVHCGDGRVTGDEKCDIGIPKGVPGACPTECPELARCNPRALNNSGCQAECVLLQMVCMSGDGCCPGNCTDKNDSDCSSKCGDGVIQEADGETCEAESNTPCKMSDAECNDEDSCTADKLIGSAKNCNALCTHNRITAPKNDDGCCPPGIDANTDNDCKSVCGNKIQEPGEECDGTTGCSATCKRMLQADQIECLEKYGNMGDACAKCSCMNCAGLYLACVDNEDATVNEKCIGVLECARKADCFGGECYCGDTLFCTPPDGACVKEIETAAGTNDTTMITPIANDPMTTLGRAYAADRCRTTQCAQQCR